MVGRMGETRPMPTKETAVAKVMAHTLAGCLNTCPADGLAMGINCFRRLGESYEVIGEGVEQPDGTLDRGVVIGWQGLKFGL